MLNNHQGMSIHTQNQAVICNYNSNRTMQMMRSRKTQNEFGKFLVIGAIAFLIDAGILSVLTHSLGLSPFVARLVSFLAAVVFTWLMNRRYTFKVECSIGFMEFFKYLSTQVLGVSINLSVFSLCIFAFDLAQTYPVLALVPATAAALFVNFISMKKFVFKSD